MEDRVLTEPLLLILAFCLPQHAPPPRGSQSLPQGPSLYVPHNPCCVTSMWEGAKGYPGTATSCNSTQKNGGQRHDAGISGSHFTTGEFCPAVVNPSAHWFNPRLFQMHFIVLCFHIFSEKSKNNTYLS